MKPSWQSLINFLLFLQLPIPRLDSTTLGYSSILRPVFWLCPFVTIRHGSHGKHSVCCWGGVLTSPLPGNRCLIVEQLFFCGNVFTDPLPSNRYTRHYTKTVCKEIGQFASVFSRHTHIANVYIFYIYIYIYRERERESRCRRICTTIS
jgi:hypothetical protein